MENWRRRIFLVLAFFLMMPVLAEEELPDIIDPDEDRVILHESNIDAFDVELGFFVGTISIQDFGSNSISGLRFAFHFTEDFFVEASTGETDLNQTSFEKLNKGFQLLSDKQREYSYYDVAIGYNLFQGESFFSSNHSFNSAFYILAGLGSTSFADEDLRTLTWGFGYRVVFLDWLSVHLDARDHQFESDIFSKDETFHSVMLHTGLTIFF